MMPTSPFDRRMPQWIDEQQTPWGRLKYALTRANLQRHLGRAPLRILDAGGGNGVDAIPLAQDGHQLDLIDASPAMLAHAAASAAAAGITDRMEIHEGEIITLIAQWPPATFDVVLCHNVLQYVPDVASLIDALGHLLKPGGLLSLISINRYSLPYQAAFLDGDLTTAYAKLDQTQDTARIFQTPMQVYTPEELSALLTGHGYRVAAYYGIRCLCDYWGDNTRKADPATFAELQRLEFALTDRHPYNLLARYLHIIAAKE
jgi:2-polyprenyl-3-methyl-5-hydroxy-6-metoxy-1,4-benzoquinol methylase